MGLASAESADCNVVLGGTQANAATRSNDGTKEPDDEDGASTAHKQKDTISCMHVVLQCGCIPGSLPRAVEC